MSNAEIRKKPEVRSLEKTLAGSVRILDFELRISRAAGRGRRTGRRRATARAGLSRRSASKIDQRSLPKSACRAEASAQAGAWQNGFQFGQNVFKARPSRLQAGLWDSLNPKRVSHPVLSCGNGRRSLVGKTR